MPIQMALSDSEALFGNHTRLSAADHGLVPSKVVEVSMRDKSSVPCPVRVEPEIELWQIHSPFVDNLNQDSQLSTDSLVFKWAKWAKY